MLASTCAYCGEERDTTADHVPPRSVMPPGAPPPHVQLITVPACGPCHTSFGRDDEYFRSVLVMRKDVAEHPDGMKLLPALFRGVERPRGGALHYSIFKTMADVELRTPEGLWVGTAPTFKPDWQRLERTTERIIRGLYYREYKVPVPLGHTVKGRPDMEVEGRDDFVAILASATKRNVWPGVFSYAFIAAAGGAGTVWALLFFGSVGFIGTTLDENDPRYATARASP